MHGTLPSRPVFAGLATERIIGSYDAGRPGPTVVICGGLHGNEPAGLVAVGRVLAALEGGRIPLRGRLLGVAGNLAALPDNRRFVERDLNRKWFVSDIERLLNEDAALDGVEDNEQRELAGLFEELGRQTDDPLVVLDLHSTSGVCPPFVCAADTLRSRRVARALPVPFILGLEESIDGTLMGFLTELGHTAIALEGGRHDAVATVDHHESAIWLVLAACGALAAHEVPDHAGHRASLAHAAERVPAIVEIRHRHPVSPGDGFRMEPGFWSFQSVEADQLLATEGAGEVRAPLSGLVLMPLYQEQGEDGFFLARPVGRVQLALSTVLRTLRMEWLLSLLPGVRRHPVEEDQWLVDAERSDGWLRSALFLFGYRRRRPSGPWVVFSRRRPGFLGRSRPLVVPPRG